MSDPWPEHTRMAEVRERSQAIGEFLEWLPSQDILLASYAPHEDGSHGLYPAFVDIQQLLAQFFDIDLRKIEAEKRAMIDLMRARHEETS